MKDKIDFLVEYLNEHPGATLDEGLNEMARVEYESEKNELKRRQEEISYNKNLSYRWFLLDFNKESKLIFQFDKISDGSKQMVDSTIAYSVFKSTDGTSIEKEVKRLINLLWLPNPYRDQYPKGTLTSRELTSNEVSEIKKMFAEYDKLNEKILKFIS